MDTFISLNETLLLVLYLSSTSDFLRMHAVSEPALADNLAGDKLRSRQGSGIETGA